MNNLNIDIYANVNKANHKDLTDILIDYVKTNIDAFFGFATNNLPDDLVLYQNLFGRIAKFENNTYKNDFDKKKCVTGVADLHECYIQNVMNNHLHNMGYNYISVHRNNQGENNQYKLDLIIRNNKNPKKPIFLDGKCNMNIFNNNSIQGEKSYLGTNVIVRYYYDYIKKGYNLFLVISTIYGLRIVSLNQICSYLIDKNILELNNTFIKNKGYDKMFELTLNDSYFNFKFIDKYTYTLSDFLQHALNELK